MIPDFLVITSAEASSETLQSHAAGESVTSGDPWTGGEGPADVGFRGMTEVDFVSMVGWKGKCTAGNPWKP